MKYAIVDIKGKQYRVEEGKTLRVDLLTADKKTLALDKVLLYVEGDDVKIGDPTVKGASVKAIILDNVRGDKLRVARFKAKSRYRKTKGHRQSYTPLKITSITLK